MTKHQTIVTCTILSVTIICLFVANSIYDHHRLKKLLDLDNFSKGQLVGEALELRVKKIILMELENGNTQDAINILREDINDDEITISTDMKKYEFSDSESSIIKRSLNDEFLQCYDNEA